MKAVAENSKTKIHLGVRVNFPVGNGLVSRFGMDVDGEDFAKSMELIEKSSYLSFSGFHCHIGTSRPVVYWAEKADRMIEIAKKFDAKYIDLGGGAYGPMPEELAKQFNGYASFEQYAETVCNKMNDAFPNHDVQLILEPGTAIVGNAMDALAHVTDIKKVRGTTYITVDICSNHLGMICECRDIPAEIIGDDNGKGEYVTNATIAGCTCLEFDYIKKGFEGKVSIGDIIIFKNVGAYSISASRQFIVPRLAVVDASTH